MAAHKFKVGQLVTLHSRRHGVWAEPFEVVRSRKGGPISIRRSSCTAAPVSSARRWPSCGGCDGVLGWTSIRATCGFRSAAPASPIGGCGFDNSLPAACTSGRSRTLLIRKTRAARADERKQRKEESRSRTRASGVIAGVAVWLPCEPTCRMPAPSARQLNRRH
jgi:hypothetical protein